MRYPPRRLTATFSERGARVPRSADPDSVGCHLGDRERVEVGRHVGIGIGRRTDLVEKLCRHGSRRDGAARARLLGHDERPVCPNLRDGEPRESGGELAEERIVPSGCLGSAFDHVSRHHRTGEHVPVVPGPVVPPRRRSQHQGRVGDSAGHHDVGTCLERGGDAPTAQVGVGGRGGGSQRGKGLARVEVSELHVSRGLHLGQRSPEVVTFDDCDRGMHSLLGRGRQQAFAEASRVETSGVGHHLDTPGQEILHCPGHLSGKDLRVARSRIPRLLLAQDRHGQFREVIAGDHVDRSRTIEHLAHGLEAVAQESRDVGDADRSSGHRPCHRGGRLSRNARGPSCASALWYTDSQIWSAWEKTSGRER